MSIGMKFVTNRILIALQLFNAYAVAHPNYVPPLPENTITSESRCFSS